MVIRNTSPNRPPPSSPTTTPTSTPTTTPADLNGMTSVDADLDAAGVTDIEKLAGQPLGDGMSVETQAALKTLTKPSTPIRDPEATAKVTDPAAVVRLINAAAEGLKPGESVTLGGKASAGAGLVIEGGLTVSVTKRADGKLDVKTTEEIAAGPGEKLGLGGNKQEVHALLGLTREVTFVVATGDEAASLMAKFALAKAAQANTVTGIVADKVYEYATRDQVSERKVAVTFEVAAAATGAAEALGLEIGAGDSVGFVESPPGKWFLEIEGTAEGEADHDGLVGKGTVKATVRIPIAAPDIDVGTPQGMLRHAEGALSRIRDAEVTLEWRNDVDVKLRGGSVTATKTVKASDLPAAAATTDGWSVRAEAVTGPRESSTTILAAEVEVTASRTSITYEGKGGSLEDHLRKGYEAISQTTQAKHRRIGAN